MANDAIDKITNQLRTIEESTARLVQGAPAAALSHPNDEGWSALDFFKHLILSVKPIVKAGETPRETLIQAFGASGRRSDPYSVIVEKYERRLKDGIRAEDAPAVTPRSLRIPTGTPDERTYLLEQWADTHRRLYKVIDGFPVVDLDMVQLPHPAIGLITFREMLYFTIYHNTLHWHDIRAFVNRGQ